MTDAAAPRRALALAIAVVAAACLAYASFSHLWLSNHFDSYPNDFGLRTSILCDDHDSAGCTPKVIANSEFADSDWGALTPNQSKAWAPFGWVTFVACLLAAAGLALAAALAIARRRPQWPIAPTTIALVAIMFAIIGGCVFVATKPGPAGWASAGIGFWAFGAGAVLGIAGSQLLARVNRPVDPDLLADAMDPEQY